MDVQTAIDDFLSTKSGETKRLYERGINLFYENIIKDVPLEQITNKHFANFCLWIKSEAKKKNKKDEWSAITQHSYTKGPRRFLSYLAVMEYCNTSTDVLLELEKQMLSKPVERKYRLPDGLEDFAIKYHDWPAPPRKERRLYLEWLRDRAFIGVLEATGTRITAACQMLVYNIEWKRDPVRILIIGKGEREHYLRIQGRQARYLKQWLSERGKAADYVFPAIRGDAGCMSDETGRNIIKRWIRYIFGEGKYHFTAHAFRHLFVTRARDAYGLEMAKRLVDHKSIATTDKYPAAYTEIELDEAYKKIYR